MLHILWLILKTILILLGILLGLVLLALAFVLFCPVRYKVSAKKETDDWKQSEGTGCISWLFHAVTFRVMLKNGEIQTVFRLFGIPVLKKRREKKQKKANVNIQKEPKKDSRQDVQQLQKRKEENPTEATTYVQQKEEMTQEQNAEKSSEKEDPEADRRNSVVRIWMRLWNNYTRFRDKLRYIERKVKNIHDQMSWWRAFLEHPRVKAAFSLVWKHAKFLIGHVLPVKVEGKVTFSTEDPSLSGTILAVLGMSVPFHKNCVDVIPLFNGENYLRGYVDMRGRIYGFVFARAALVIYFNKNVKYVIKRWKHKEG